MLCSDQNAIHLCAQELTDAEKFFFPKGLSFSLNPTYINWPNLKCDFDNFVNTLRYMTAKSKVKNQKMRIHS